MKKNIFLSGVMAVAAAGMLSSCSSDYLDLKPVTTITEVQITANADLAEADYNGVLDLFYAQVANGQAGSNTWGEFMICNGLGWLNSYHEQLTSDFFFYYWPARGAMDYAIGVSNWTYLDRDDTWFTVADWLYYYSVIGRANSFLTAIDDMEIVNKDDPAKRDFWKAGILSVRAFCYFKLLEMYGPRWEDSNNGQELVLPIRDVENKGAIEAPLKTMNEVVAFCRADLDEALKLFDGSSISRSDIVEIDKSVAQGIYARLCMLIHDFPTAQKMAHDARQGYPIMSSAEYKSGFCDANAEWMWSHVDFGLYYWSFGSLYSCNEGYPVLWGVTGAGAINMDLYRQIPEGDIRRDLFLTPDKMTAPALREDRWYNSKFIDPADMNLNGKVAAMQVAIAAFGQNLKPSAAFSDPYVDNSGQNKDGVMIPYGAQYKFWAKDTYGTSRYPFMRASEMLLTEAEAAYENNQPQVAISCLEELNAKRQPGYTCSKSGNELRDEIRLYRRIELWGEGFNFFDYKRWNIDMVRNCWVEGDVTSNNVPTQFKMTKTPSDLNGWRFKVPKNEYMYNTAIQRANNQETTPQPAQIGKH